jgi:hypothetical protein
MPWICIMSPLHPFLCAALVLLVRLEDPKGDESAPGQVLHSVLGSGALRMAKLDDSAVGLRRLWKLFGIGLAKEATLRRVLPT